MTRAQLIRQLRAHGACPAALRWIARHPDKTPQQLWERCLNEGYLTWYVWRFGTPAQWWALTEASLVTIGVVGLRSLFPRIAAIGKGDAHES